MKELSLTNAKVNLAVFKEEHVVSEESKAKVREYAKLVKVQSDLQREIEKVSKLLRFIDARWCKGYIWINQQGEVIPIFDIDDDYLKNIYNWSIKNRRNLGKGIMKEYISRFGIPDSLPEEGAKYTGSDYRFDEDDEEDFF